MKSKFFTIITILLFSAINTIAQNTNITPKLQNALSIKSAEAYLPIRIEFNQKVDCFEMNLEFKQDGVPVKDRPQLVIEALMAQSDLSQAPIRAILHNGSKSDYKNLQSFWIANIMVLEAKEELILALSQRSDIAILDLEDNKFIPHDKYIVEDGAAVKEENGIEPGLEAINAPAMWALGYTGRGQVVYDYDTGVWPMHPAFSDRYMGNFFPTGQSWYGYHFDLPSGHINSHGTHTLGTIAGLVEATNDTIGVAFESYWLANDYVEQTVAELLPITEMVTAFEWALNPDGDVTTSYDVPDVISNSWRWYDEEDQVHCEEGFVVDIMNAIEAAGIANIFSGGNFGPDNTSVSSPQRINTSEVNTFSVGSVNATNFWFPYPLSGFSSHGPTQCPGEGSLEIHPEVVAPGQNVRSAWGHDDFNTISGTSMATPHVSGAVLLLKEAFPELSGEDLLWALYLTAIDLGEEGEDNLYGNGLIDVFAAFEYLSETNTPVDPNAVAWDLELTDILNVPEQGFSCIPSYSPTVVMTNKGMNTIEEIELSYKVDEGAIQTTTWTGSLEAGSSVDIVLSSMVPLDFGDVELNFVSSIVGQPDEYDIYNNRRILRYNRRDYVALPFQEGFENGFEYQDWHLDNVDQYITWDTIPTEGLENNEYSASMQYFNYDPREDQKDRMTTPIMNLAGEQVTLSFYRSYPKYQSNSQYRDTLRVLLSTDCGQTWPHVVFEKFSTQLSTMDTLVGDFVPEYDTHWKNDLVDLSEFSGEDVLIQFEGTNKKGNNLYIDNIQIYSGETPPVGIVETEQLRLRISPNPAHNFIKLEGIHGDLRNADLFVFDSKGKIVIQQRINAEVHFLEIDQLPTGVYTVRIELDGVVCSEKFVKF